MKFTSITLLGLLVHVGASCGDDPAPCDGGSCTEGGATDGHECHFPCDSSPCPEDSVCNNVVDEFQDVWGSNENGSFNCVFSGDVPSQNLIERERHRCGDNHHCHQKAFCINKNDPNAFCQCAAGFSGDGVDCRGDNEPREYELSERDNFGSIFGVRTRKATMKSCMAKCDYNKYCVGIAYKNEAAQGEENCMMVKNLKTAASTSEGWSLYTAVVQLSDTTTYEVVRTGGKGNGRYQGGELTVEGCQEVCDTDPNCMGVGFNEGGRRGCRLLTNLKENGSGSLVIYKKQIAEPSTYEIFRAGRKGSVYGSPQTAASVEECGSFCNIDPKCYGVYYDAEAATETKNCRKVRDLRRRAFSDGNLYKRVNVECGSGDFQFLETPSKTRENGEMTLHFEYDEANFLQTGETFTGLEVKLGTCVFEYGDRSEANNCNAESSTNGGDDGAWFPETPQVEDGGIGGSCKTVTLETTLNNLVTSCGFSANPADFQSAASSIDLTLLRGLVEYRSSTQKISARGTTEHRCFSRSTILAIKMGTTVTVTTDNLQVFGFAINNFAVTDVAFDAAVRAGNDHEDLSITFVTTVQWPYILTTPTFGTEFGATEPNGNFLVRAADEYLRQDTTSGCDEPSTAVPCKQTWKVTVYHKDACSAITPLELDGKWNVDFDIECHPSFTGACTEATDPRARSNINGDGVSTSEGDTGFNTNPAAANTDADDAHADQQKKNGVYFTTDSDNYCTRVLDEIPLEGSIAVYDTDYYNQVQDQFVFGSTAFVKVKVHARAEIANIHVERIQLDHVRGTANNPDPDEDLTQSQIIYSDVINTNADFAGATSVDYKDVPQVDSELEVRNDELNKKKSGEHDDNKDDDSTNELLNEAQATFNFVWNEHTSPAGSADEDAATTTTITVDVRVQFKAAVPASRFRRMLLQAAAATPATRQQAVVGVVRGRNTAEADEVVGSAPTQTPCYFVGLALGVCAAF